MVMVMVMVMVMLVSVCYCTLCGNAEATNPINKLIADGDGFTSSCGNGWIIGYSDEGPFAEERCHKYHQQEFWRPMGVQV